MWLTLIGGDSASGAAFVALGNATRYLAQAACKHVSNEPNIYKMNTKRSEFLKYSKRYDYSDEFHRYFISGDYNLRGTAWEQVDGYIEKDKCGDLFELYLAPSEHQDKGEYKCYGSFGRLMDAKAHADDVVSLPPDCSRNHVEEMTDSKPVSQRGNGIEIGLAILSLMALITAAFAVTAAA